MQVFGLPGHVIRNAGCASRLFAAQPPDIEAAKRRDALARWRQAMARGLSAADAAEAVGVPRATLYRWEKQPRPRSRRPHRLRQPAWSPALVEAALQFRLDNPMWGKRKIAVLLKREGFAVSTSTVGRILAKLVARGAIVAVPTLRRKPGGRRFRLFSKDRHAKRLPKGRKASRPGELVQIDTLSINIRPDKPIKHFTAYDPVAKWTVGRVAGNATATAASTLLDKLIEEAPFPISGIQVDGGSEFMADTNCPTASISSNRSSTASPIATTTSGRTTPSTSKLQPSISNQSANEIPASLICAEPGQNLAIPCPPRYAPPHPVHG